MSIKLLPCPFCGDDEPEFERMGTGRQSCIVICTNCGCRHDSGDSGEHNGTSWNRRPREDKLIKLLKEARNGLTAAWFGSSLLQRIKNALGEE